MIIHAVVLGLLILYTMFAWNSSKREAAEAKEAAHEEFLNSDIDPYAEVKLAEKKNPETSAMVKVGVPFLITVIYGGVLTVLYILPMFVDKIGEEIMGSSAEVEDDPLDEARAAVAAGDYAEAIQVYRKVWLLNREAGEDDRFPVVEIAKLQRTKLESPVVAVSTLKEALDDHEWPEEDVAFMMFRIAEIYEEDLDDREGLITTLKSAVEKLDGTRHSANAAHRLRELGEGESALRKRKRDLGLSEGGGSFGPSCLGLCCGCNVERIGRLGLCFFTARISECEASAIMVGFCAAACGCGRMARDASGGTGQ